DSRQRLVAEFRQCSNSCAHPSWRAQVIFYALQPAPFAQGKFAMPLPSLPVLGVRFDIDKLLKYSGGNYAETAWTIIWQSLDPSLLKGASLWHGDSGATLNHRENVFCIAIQSSDAGSLKQAQSLLAGSSELGGVAAVPPFAE